MGGCDQCEPETGIPAEQDVSSGLVDTSDDATADVVGPDATLPDDASPASDGTQADVSPPTDVFIEDTATVSDADVGSQDVGSQDVGSEEVSTGDTNNADSQPTDVATPDTTPPSWTDATLEASDLTDTSVTLAWSGASDDTAVIAYRIFRGDEPIAEVTSETTSYSDTGLTPETVYLFAVQAGDAAGNWSTGGPTADVTTLATPDTAPPSWTDASLEASDLTDTSVALAWSGASDDTAVTAYRIFRGDEPIAEVTPETTSYSDTGLTPETAYLYAVQAGDEAGNWSTDGPTADVTTLATPDTTPPVWTDAQVTVSDITDTSFTVSWSGFSEDASSFRVLLDGEQAAETSDTEIGLGGLSPATTYVVTVQAADDAGNWTLDGPETNVQTLNTIPPEPEDVAPPLAAADEIPSFDDLVSFLVQGEDPVQTGAEDDAFLEARTALVAGEVVGEDGQPLAGVTVTCLEQPEVGSTATRLDGHFDLLVNGGQEVTIHLEISGRLPSQRTVYVSWEGGGSVGRVVLIQQDAAVNTVDLTGATFDWQVAQSTPQSDCEGCAERTSTILFPPGVSAEVIADGEWVPVVDFGDVQLTEFTVGEDGPARMPGGLPPNSGYTFAVDLAFSLGQEKVGGKDVLFVDDQGEPAVVYLYVDNFLGFPAGTVVPSGFYDKDRAEWLPEMEGMIIDFTGVEDGLAVLETGDAPAPTISDEERALLSTLFDAPSSFMRTPLPHFSTVDLNYGVTSAPGSAAPENDEASPEKEDNCRSDCGSVLELDTQSLREFIPLAGMPEELFYSSRRMAGFTADTRLKIPLTPELEEEALSLLQVVTLEVTILGETETFHYDCQEVSCSNLSHLWSWNSASFGRDIRGQRNASVSIAYGNPGYYLLPYSEKTKQFPWAFGNNSGRVISDIPTRIPVFSRQSYEVPVTATPDNEHLGLGGWSLSGIHTLDPGAAVLYLGDGTRAPAQGNLLTMQTFAGTGAGGTAVDGAPATETPIHHPYGVTVAPDGAVLIASHWSHRIYSVGDEGLVTTVVGGSSVCPEAENVIGDGCPALEAKLNLPLGAIVGPDGLLYVNDWGNDRIRRVSADGLIETFVGGTSCAEADALGDGCLASATTIEGPAGFDFAPDGSLWFADTNHHRIRRVDPNGRVFTMVGTGVAGFSGDGGPADQAELNFPAGIVFDREGRLFVSDMMNHRVRRIDPDGLIQTVAGNGSLGYDGSGLIALESRLRFPGGLAISPEGELFIADGAKVAQLESTSNHCVRVLRTSGELVDYAGKCASVPKSCSPPSSGEDCGDSGPVLHANMAYPTDLAFSPTGVLYIADHEGDRVRMVDPHQGADLSDAGAYIPSASGSVYYVFDQDYRHVETVDRWTGATLRSIDYYLASHPPAHPCALTPASPPTGSLCQLVDRAGRITSFTRDEEGQTIITSPDGHVTTLTLDPETGLMTAVTDPAGNTWSVTYKSDPDDSVSTGLMETFVDPDGKTTTFQWDEQGRLTSTAHGDLPPMTLSTVHSTMPPTGPEVSPVAVTTTSKSSPMNNTWVREAFTPYVAGGSQDPFNDEDPTYNGGTLHITTTPANTQLEEVLSADGLMRRFRYPDGREFVTERETDPSLGSKRTPLSQVVRTQGVSAEEAQAETLSIDREVALAPSASNLEFESVTLEFYRDDALSQVIAWDKETATYSATSATGLESSSTLDDKGRDVLLESPSHGVLELTYDDEGRVASMQRVDPTGVSPERLWTFNHEVDDEGALSIEITNPLQESSILTMNPHGYLITLNHGGAYTVDIERDAYGRILSLTPEDSAAFEQSYDPNGMLTQFDPPVATAYDLQGEPVPGVLTQGPLACDWDADQRLLRYGPPEPAPGLNITPLDHSRIESISGPLFQQTWTWDPAQEHPLSVHRADLLAPNTTLDTGLSRLFSAGRYMGSVWSGAVQGEVQLVRDTNGQVLEETSTTGDTSETTVYTYDADGKLTSAGPLDFELDPTTGLKTSGVAGGVYSDWVYNGFGELIGHGHGLTEGESALWDVTITRDDLGRISTLTETIDGATSTTRYTYDTTGQLTLVEGAIEDGWEVLSDHTYDSRLNRISVAPDDATPVALFDEAGRLIRHGDVVYTWNEEGAIESVIDEDGTWSLIYDLAGNLRQLETPTGAVIDYIIGPVGRRLGSVVDGVPLESFLYGDDLRPTAWLGPDGELKARFIYREGPGAAIAMATSEGTFRLLRDHLGSVRLVVDAATGMIRERTDYGPWGSVEHREVYDAGGTLIADAPAMHPFGFAGGMRDVHHPWVRFGARDYDPIAGRWLSRDPLLFAGGDTNLFRYVNNDPVNTTDPQGLFTWKDGLQEAGGLKFNYDNVVGIPDKFKECMDMAMKNPSGGCEDNPMRMHHAIQVCMQTGDVVAPVGGPVGLIFDVGKWLNDNLNPWADEPRTPCQSAEEVDRRMAEEKKGTLAGGSKKCGSDLPPLIRDTLGSGRGGQCNSSP